VPGHSFKYIAALQAANIGPKPHLIRVESRAGHASGGIGKPTEKLIAEYADEWTFIGYFTGLTSGKKSADVQIHAPNRN
jgi:prolyl oligopeptidase